jgi:hypothetical protein
VYKNVQSRHAVKNGLHNASPSFVEILTPALGADFDNVFNHPLKAPDFSDNGGDGGGHPFAFLGDFNVNVNRR